MTTREEIIEMFRSGSRDRYKYLFKPLMRHRVYWRFGLLLRDRIDAQGVWSELIDKKTKEVLVTRKFIDE